MLFTELNLHADILKAIQVCGYTKPTPVQAKAIPAILQGQDVVASAQTGTGKTAAFVLPALHHLMESEPVRKPRILILTPTRELAAQITTAASLYGKYSRFNIISLVGGMPYSRQIRDLQRGADIVVATPGRLMDHMEQGRIDLSGITMLVLDEADRMLDMGFIEDVELIANKTPKQRQTLLFSATMDKQLTQVVKHILKNPLRIDLSTEVLAPAKIQQVFYRVDNPHQKSRALQHILKTESVYKAIIFSATKIYAEKLANELQDLGYAASPLHGDLRQNQRTRTVQDLERGKIQFIVATDVAARGIHINDISHVINFDLPKFSEDYVHRIGRTGRAGKEGIAISFILASDNRNLQRIERLMGKRAQVQRLDTSAPISAPADKTLSISWDDAEDVSSRRKRRSQLESFSQERDGRPAAKISVRPPKKRWDAKERFADKPNRSGAGGGRFEKKSFDRDARPSDRSDRPFARKRFDRDARSSERSDKSFGRKSFDRDNRSADRSESYGKSRFEKKDSYFADRDARSSERSGKPFGKKPAAKRPSDRDFKPANRSGRSFGKTRFAKKDGSSFASRGTRFGSDKRGSRASADR